MRRFVEQAEQHLPEFVRSFLGRFGRLDNPLSRQYTYAQITQNCDLGFAQVRERNFRNLPPFRNALGEYETFAEAYSQLHQTDSPAPIAAAVIIGLARAGNLMPSDVEALRRTSHLLRVAPDDELQLFCAAIDQNARRPIVMKESSRPDFALFRQLASLATLSHRTLRLLGWRLTRYRPYETLDGQIIAQKGFIDSLGGGELGAACVRFAVDLGVLTTQPEKMTADEREWCRRNMHFNRMVGDSSLNGRLEKFKGFVSLS